MLYEGLVLEHANTVVFVHMMAIIGMSLFLAFAFFVTTFKWFVVEIDYSRRFGLGVPVIAIVSLLYAPAFLILANSSAYLLVLAERMNPLAMVTTSTVVLFAFLVIAWGLVYCRQRLIYHYEADDFSKFGNNPRFLMRGTKQTKQLPVTDKVERPHRTKSVVDSFSKPLGTT